MPEFTILMPCLNEEENIARCIAEAKEYIGRRQLSAEILISDNGSSDRSADIARSMGARVVRVEKIGYGSAVIGGIYAAKGRYIIMGDCDGSYDFSQLDGFVDCLRSGSSLVIGNRFGGIERGAMPLSHRYFGVPLLSLLGRLRYRVGVSDFHCGIRGFVREKALLLDLKSEGMEFATELIGKFAVSGEEIKEIPVILRCRGGRSHLRTIPDGLRHLRFIITDSCVTG